MFLLLPFDRMIVNLLGISLTVLFTLLLVFIIVPAIFGVSFGIRKLYMKTLLKIFAVSCPIVIGFLPGERRALAERLVPIRSPFTFYITVGPRHRKLPRAAQVVGHNKASASGLLFPLSQQSEVSPCIHAERMHRKEDLNFSERSRIHQNLVNVQLNLTDCFKWKQMRSSIS